MRCLGCGWYSELNEQALPGNCTGIYLDKEAVRHGFIFRSFLAMQL